MELAGMFAPADPAAMTPAVDTAMPAAQDAATAPDPATAGTDPADKRVQSLMAKEAALLQREQALRATEADIAKRAREEALAELRREFQLNPVDSVRRLAPDNTKLRDVAGDLWYEETGDGAPPEYKAKKAERTAAALAAENARLKAESEARAKREAEATAQQEAEQLERAYVAGLQEYLPAVPDSLARAKYLASTKPEVATGMMLDAARSIASQAAAENWSPDRFAQATTPAAVAAAVDAYLERIGYATSPAAPAQPTAVAPAAPTSLRNTHSAGQGGRAPVDANDETVRRRNALIAVGLPPDLLDNFR
jgi:hypothetical protein